MNCYKQEELMRALKEVTSTINKCEKIHGKFAVGTSQHTLLKNRIKAMYISKLLLEEVIAQRENLKGSKADDTCPNFEFETSNVVAHYTKEELHEAIRPVASIISKCEKGQAKFEEGTSHHTRFKNIIEAMSICKVLIEDAISRNDSTALKAMNTFKNALNNLSAK